MRINIFEYQPVDSSPDEELGDGLYFERLAQALGVPYYGGDSTFRYPGAGMTAGELSVIVDTARPIVQSMIAEASAGPDAWKNDRLLGDHNID